MGNVIGARDVIQRVESARGGDGYVYVNMDAIRQLPDQYEAQISKVEFDPEKDFYSIEKNDIYMPTPGLYAAIAMARGVEGDEQSIFEPIYEDVDIGPMLMKPMDADPVIRKTKVGYIATKTGYVLHEDGTKHYSDPCTVVYHVWDRCRIFWAAEEKATNGYDPAIVHDGKYRVDTAKKSWTAYCKYDTIYKRQNHFAEEMKFAQRKADTKARHLVIRVLAGLKTGYKLSELQEGAFYFAKIRRSQNSLKLEQAARLHAISNGIDPRSAQTALFGHPQGQGQIEDTNITTSTSAVEANQFDEPFMEPIPPVSSSKIELAEDHHEWTILAVYRCYYDAGIIPDVYIQYRTGKRNLREQATRAIEQMEAAVDAVGYYNEDETSYPHVLKLLQKIEERLPEQEVIEHQLY